MNDFLELFKGIGSEHALVLLSITMKATRSEMFFARSRSPVPQLQESYDTCICFNDHFLKYVQLQKVLITSQSWVLVLSFKWANINLALSILPELNAMGIFFELNRGRDLHFRSLVYPACFTCLLGTWQEKMLEMRSLDLDILILFRTGGDLPTLREYESQGRCICKAI